MAEPVTNGVKNLSMQGLKHAQSEEEQEGGVVSPLDGVNGHTEDALLMTDTTRQVMTLDTSGQGQGQGQDMTSPPSQDHTDSKYEFDPVSTGSSSAPLSPPETTDSSSGMFVDFDGVAKHVHEASTASVSPQSPENMAPDDFMQENKENSDPMTSSIIAGDPMTSSMVGGDLMSSSFIGDLIPESSPVAEDLNSSLVCDYNVSDVMNDVDGVPSELPPGGPMSDAALQEIGVYGAPPPEESGDLVSAPVNDLVCLDEDGMEMPTTHAPTVPPSNSGALHSNAFSNNPFSDSLINTQAPMGQFDPFKAEVNGAQSANPFDSIPGQPPIGIAPSLQPKEAFVDPAPALIPTTEASSAAPGGPVMAAPMEPEPPVQPPLPPFGVPPKNEPLFEKQPLPDVANVKVAPGSGGQDALLLEDVKTENGPSAPVVPPIDLSSFDSSPKKPASPTKQSESPRKAEPQQQSVPDSSKIPSPKKAKPQGATETKKATPVKQTNATATSNNNKAPAKKVSPTSAAAKPATAPTKAKTPAKAPISTRAPSAQKQSPRTPPTRPSPREPVKKSPRTTKDGASDSGIEDEKTSPRKSTPTSRPTPKKYGTDSVANIRHKPGGGNVRIFSEKVVVKNVGPRTDCKPSPRTPQSPRSSTSSKSSTPMKTTPSPNTKNVGPKIGSTANIRHVPGGGNVKITHQKRDLSTVKSKCGTMSNLKHTPRGGEKKIESQKVEWKAQSKVGSLDNARHRAGGGEKKIESKKLEWNVTSRVGSLDNARHKAGGGEKKIETRKLDFKDKAQSKVGSKDNIKHQAGGGDKKIESVKLDFRDKAQSKVGSKDNIKHQAGGGDKKIETTKVEWKAESKVGSLDYVHHQAGGGDKEIETHKLEFRDKAQSKVGSKDNIKHQAGGGDKMIETHRLEFREKAQARTDTGFVSGTGSQGGSQYTGSETGSVGEAADPGSPLPAAAQ